MTSTVGMETKSTPAQGIAIAHVRKQRARLRAQIHELRKRCLFQLDPELARADMRALDELVQRLELVEQAIRAGGPLAVQKAAPKADAA